MTSFDVEVGSRLYYFIKYKILGFLGLLILLLLIYLATVYPSKYATDWAIAMGLVNFGKR